MDEDWRLTKIEDTESGKTGPTQRSPYGNVQRSWQPYSDHDDGYKKS